MFSFVLAYSFNNPDTALHQPRTTLVVLLLLLIAPLSLAQSITPFTLPNTQIHRLTSQHTGVEYVLYVSLPRDYTKSSQTYPVVYTLDADYSFALTHNIVEHFVDRGNLPPMIVVSIAYEGANQDPRAYRLNRTRDYTPSYTSEGGYGPAFQKVSGGGPSFLQFIQTELIPHIEATFRTKPNDQTMVGHSFGGLFGTFALLTSPNTFQRYIIVSPSLWYDDQMIFDVEAERAASGEAIAATVFFGVGSYENQPHNGRAMVDDLHRMAQRLQSHSYPDLTITTQVFDQETHNSVFPAALTRGLRAVFSTN